jgi:ribokinase
MTKFDVVGFGALNVDKLFSVDRIAERGGESFVTYSTESCGGSAANTIVGLARLGLKTGFIGKVADDREGNLLLQGFRSENVDTEGIAVTKTGRSGVVMGFVDQQGERTLYVDAGVNDEIDLSEIKLNHVLDTRLLHITSFAGDRSFESQVGILEKVSTQTRISFDPGMLYARKGLAALRPIVQRAFVMLPNQAELRLLTGKEYEEGAEALVDAGVKIVGVKLGEKGCYVTDGEENTLVAAARMKPLDTTGAGDAWNAGFLYGFLQGKNLEQCGMLGNFAASRCIVKMGARTGLPLESELKQL